MASQWEEVEARQPSVLRSYQHHCGQNDHYSRKVDCVTENGSARLRLEVGEEAEDGHLEGVFSFNLTFI